MVCRALGFAAVLLVVCGGLAMPAQAQENLDAGKSPSQLFAGNCSACHKSPRGLLKTIPPGSLPGFLRQHYTTGPDMAGVLAGYLTANGAGDASSERSGRRHRAKPDAEPAAPEAGADAEKPHARHGHKSRHRRGEEAAKPNAATEPSDAAKPSDAKPAAEEKPAASSAGAADPAAPAAH